MLIALAALIAVTTLSVPSRSVEADETDDFTIAAFPHLAPAQFNDNWGARRPGGRRHKGIDIMSARGTPVVAAASGTVIFMGTGRLAGFYLKIQHADGWVTSYLHLNNDTPGTDDGQGGSETAFATGVNVGDLVNAGQIIAYVGDSGTPSEPPPTPTSS
jgi:murein DD-endopeptidase MepM/ murein hydrolase activator NlpD